MTTHQTPADARVLARRGIPTSVDPARTVASAESPSSPAILVTGEEGRPLRGSGADDDLTVGARWSSAVSCARRAVLEHQGADRDPVRIENAESYWRRGHAISNAIRGEIVAELRDAGRRPRAEERVPWPADAPIGTGHADLYVPSEQLVVEITTTAGSGLEERKALQAAGYALEHPNAERALVISVDPSTMQRRDYPIDVDGLAPKVREIQARVVAGIRTGVLPDRACCHPHDGPSAWCPFVARCFADWQPDSPDLAIGSDAAFEALAECEDDLADAKQRVRDLEAERDELRDDLRRVVEVGATVESGLVRIRRTPVAGRETFSLTAYRAAGHTLPAAADAFLTRSAPSERWTVKRIGIKEEGAA